MTHSSLSLPCLRGTIGDWNYYNVVIPFKELNRISNDHIIKEAKSLDHWLQRKLTKRKDLIKDYLLNEEERFFSSVIIGVYGDVPDWVALDLKPVAEKFKINLGNQVEDSLGVLSLTGKEILFTIDGQHRIEGIRLAIKENPERFENDELSVILIAHNKNKAGRIRTRKLFATINREAVKPSSNDLAIIDEIYAYNVIARDLYAQFKPFKDKIALTDTPDLDRNNHEHFTNLLGLVAVNKKILRLVKEYKQTKYQGPTVEERDLLYKEAVSFWNFVIENISKYSEYFNGELTLPQVRNNKNDKPLNLLFVPIGQKFLGEIFYIFKKRNQLDELKAKINRINFDLHEGHFVNIFYDPIKNRMIMNNQTLAKNLFLYLMGDNIDETKLKDELAKAYGINVLSEDFKNLELPQKL
jgi:DNA sulfur modification protein DndB